MRIAKLVIDNFRSIKRLEIKLPQVCALVGPNNAGKSNILLAIQRVLGREWVSVSSFDRDDVYARDDERDVLIKVTVEPPIKYRKFKDADPVEISTLSFEYTRYRIGADKGSRRLEQKCFDASGRPPQALSKAPRKGEKRQYQPLVNIPQDVRESVPLIYISTNRALKDHLPGARNSLLRILFEDICRDLRESTSTVTYRDARGAENHVTRLERYRQIMEEAMKLLRTDQFAALEASIKNNALRQLGFDPAIDADKLDLSFSPFEPMDFYRSLEMLVREGQFSINATQLGDGIQNAIVLSILQAFEKQRKAGAILLIEEPEMFLHPQMQRSLAATLREIGKTNQIIFTTHSPHFVSIPEYEQVLVVRKDSGGTRVTASSLEDQERRREKLIKEFDPERNELFFATRLLLVEGDTEKLALPEYAKRLGLDLDRAGATIVEVGGKRNIPEFARIAQSFGIPTGILYDKDSSDFGSDRVAEAEFNSELESLAGAEAAGRVWRLERNFEDHLKLALGESGYREACGRYPNVGKPTRARLIAQEPNSQIPEPLEDVLNWLAGPAKERRPGSVPSEPRS